MKSSFTHQPSKGNCAASQLTILQTHGSHRLAKHVRSADEIATADALPYKCHFTSTEELDSIDDLHATLEDLASRANQCVIRGQLIEGTVQPCRRLLKPRTEDGVHYPATIRDVPRAWLMVDIDSLPEPEGLDFKHCPARCADYARSLLPEPFRTTRCVWRASGSAGFKPGIRLHLWFLLDRALAGDECKAWLSHAAAKTDRTVYGAVQPHYTADPVLDVPDPMRERLGVLDGEHERVQVPVELPQDLQERSKSAVPVPGGESNDNGRELHILLRLALNKWEATHPWDDPPGLGERFECPACGSSDGCMRFADGKLHCFGDKHTRLDPMIGHATSNGYVMTRFEAVERVPWVGVQQRLTELGFYPAPPTPKKGNAIVNTEALSETHYEATATIIDPKAYQRMLKQLDAVVLALRGVSKPEQAEALAYTFARQFVPELSSKTYALDRMLNMNGRQGPRAPIYDKTIEDAINRGLDRGECEQWIESDHALSIDIYGRPERTPDNVMLLLLGAQEFTDVLAYDVRAQRRLVTAAPPWIVDDEGQSYPRPISDADYSFIGVHLARVCKYPGASIEHVRAAVSAACMARQVDPVLEYLDGLSAWDGTLEDAREACSTWLHVFAGAADDAYTRAVAMRWLIGAVARAYEPGCKNREVLTLIGPQNKGKSMLLGSLCPRSEWFLDDLNLKKTPEHQMQGAWIVELAEIDKLTAQDRHGELKSFISSNADKFRVPYGHEYTQVPRRSVFVGTANPARIFRDPTGNTRFNVVQVGSGDLDVQGIAEMRDGLWTAARMLYKAGEPWWLQADEKIPAAAKQDEHREIGDVEGLLTELIEMQHSLRDPSKRHNIFESPKRFRPETGQLDADERLKTVETRQLRAYLLAHGVRPGALDRQIADTMRRCGWRECKNVGGHRGVRGWDR